MAGETGAENSQFKGMARYFNSTTLTGRANVSISLWKRERVMLRQFCQF